MMDVGKQKRYWLNGAKDDFESAKILIRSKRMLHGLFFCHLAVEKIIKAHVVNQTKEFAPRSHNLIYLSDLAKILLSKDDEIFLGILMKYQLQGRYPDYHPTIPDRRIVFNYVNRTEKILIWLEEKL